MNKYKQTFASLIIVMAGMLTFQSCEKEPVQKDPIIICPPPGECNLKGKIIFLPSDCNLGFTTVLGILGTDGKTYQVQTDKTGLFASAQLDDQVTFGYDRISGPCLLTQNCNKPKPDHCIDLNCLTITGKNTECNKTATVVGLYSDPAKTRPMGGKVLHVDGEYYRPVGDFADAVNNCQEGEVVQVGFEVKEGCFIPAVVTYPSAYNCADIYCFSRPSAYSGK